MASPAPCACPTASRARSSRTPGSPRREKPSHYLARAQNVCGEGSWGRHEQRDASGYRELPVGSLPSRPAPTSRTGRCLCAGSARGPGSAEPVPPRDPRRHGLSGRRRRVASSVSTFYWCGAAAAPRKGPQNMPGAVGGLAGFLEATLLSADASAEQVGAMVREAAGLGCAGACVNPVHVGAAARAGAESPIRIVSVAGFPPGCVARRRENRRVPPRPRPRRERARHRHPDLGRGRRGAGAGRGGARADPRKHAGGRRGNSFLKSGCFPRRFSSRSRESSTGSSRSMPRPERGSAGRSRPGTS